jgi:hypothetical protein
VDEAALLVGEFPGCPIDDKSLMLSFESLRTNRARNSSKLTWSSCSACFLSSPCFLLELHRIMDLRKPLSSEVIIGSNGISRIWTSRSQIVTLTFRSARILHHDGSEYLYIRCVEKRLRGNRIKTCMHCSGCFTGASASVQLHAAARYVCGTLDQQL